MYRIGKVVSIDVNAQIGEIIDEHDQEIFFSITHHPFVKTGDAVQFNIELTPEGLRAVEVSPLIHRNPEPEQMHHIRLDGEA